MAFHSGPNLGVSRGQNGGQKSQNVPFSRKNEYYELEFFNHTLDRVWKLTVTQMKHDISFLAQFRSLLGSKRGSTVSKYAHF